VISKEVGSITRVMVTMAVVMFFFAFGLQGAHCTTVLTSGPTSSKDAVNDDATVRPECLSFRLLERVATMSQRAQPVPDEHVTETSDSS
jgi:hypothetical protein